MTVEQLEIVITANSDDLDAKLAEVNLQLEEFEKNAAEVFKAYNVVETVSASDFQTAVTATGAAAGSAGLENIKKNTDYTPEIPYDYSVPALDYYRAAGGSEYIKTAAGGMAENIPALLLSGAAQSSAAKKAAERTAYEGTASGDLHISLEVDGDVLAETVVKNQIKKIIRTNGMTE